MAPTGLVQPERPGREDGVPGTGTYRVINGVRVFFPADGGVPVAQLYNGADDVVGMTSNQIEICAHAL